jgi:hypothetical protein
MKAESDISKASNLLSTPPSELEKPPAAVEQEGQEALVKQEASTESKEVAQETPEAKAESDTEVKPELHKVKIDGEEVEVPYDELLKGYSRETHYQKKAKALSQEAETIKAKQAELDNIISEASVFIEDKQAKLDSDELKRLRVEDPDEYLSQVEKLEADIQKFERIKSKRQEELDAKNSELIAKERELLFDAFPHWKDDEAVMATEAGEMFKALESIGFTEDELNAVSDHRMFLLAKAKLDLDKIESANLEDKEIKPETKSLDPSSKSKPEVSSAGQKAREKLRKTGKINDAALALAN